MIGFLWIDNSQKNSINVKKKVSETFSIYFLLKKTRFLAENRKLRLNDRDFACLIAVKKWRAGSYRSFAPKNWLIGLKIRSWPPPYIGRRAKKSNWILADNRLQQKLFFYIFVMQGTILSYCNVKEFAIVKLTPNRHSLVYLFMYMWVWGRETQFRW